MRRLHTAVPLPVLRSSGSRVRLPVITSRLMLLPAMTAALPWFLFCLESLCVETTAGGGGQDRLGERFLPEEAEFSRSRCGCDAPVTVRGGWDGARAGGAPRGPLVSAHREG